MRLPDAITCKVLAGYSLGFGCDPAGMVQEWPPSTNGICPPVGYLRWTVLEVGNGDTYGYYWPVGKEDQDPIVCTTEHDASRVVPLASTLEGCLRIMHARRWANADEVKEVARAFEVSLADAQPASASDAAHELTTLDPRSPELLLAVSREAFRAGDLSTCERHLALALDLLPEYAEASFALAQFYHRQGNLERAAGALLVAISSPLCFGGYELRLKCLRGLQRMKDEAFSGQDPLWRERQRLTFQTGVKRNDDFHIYEEAITSYLEAGDGVRAIRLRMLVGELMSWETVSFNARYGWTPTKQRQDLMRDLLRANLSARVAALEATSG